MLSSAYKWTCRTRSFQAVKQHPEHKVKAIKNMACDDWCEIIRYKVLAAAFTYTYAYACPNVLVKTSLKKTTTMATMIFPLKL